MLIYILMISFSAQANPKQKRINPKKLKMIEFLVKHNDLIPMKKDNPYDYEDAIYERIIYDKKKHDVISIFGSLSPHSKKYVAIETSKDTVFLETHDLASELPTVLSFFKNHTISEHEIIRILSEITEAYQYNIKANFRTTPQ